MVKLDSEYLFRKIIKKSYVSENDKNKALKKINHLCLSNKFIEKIEGLSLLINVAVLYLHENRITKIENLDKNLNITHLYLQHNAIEKIENINHLKMLQKLYIGHNLISVVESLDSLPNLQELHVQSQKLPPGEPLYFDPRTVRALSKTLKVLDISNNQISTLEDLKQLEMIEELDASNNKISDLYTTCRVLAQWQHLKSLQILGNPLVKIAKYSEKITSYTLNLSHLDGKIIKDETRSFLQQFEMAKIERRKAEEKRSTQFKFNSDIECLAEHLPIGIRNSISRSILRETCPDTKRFNSPQFPEIKEITTEKRLMPRPIKKNTNYRTSKSNNIQNNNNVIPQLTQF